MFLKVRFFKSQPLVILTIFEFSRQTIEDTKLLENVAFQRMRFLTISNGQNFTFSQIIHSEMSVLVKNSMTFWRENSNLVKFVQKILF